MNLKIVLVSFMISLVGCISHTVSLDANSISHLDSNTAAINGLSARYDRMVTAGPNQQITQHIVCRKNELHAVTDTDKQKDDIDLGKLDCPAGTTQADADKCKLKDMTLKIAQAKCTLGELK